MSTRGVKHMSNELAIEASGLAKSYGGVRVLGGIDLRVPRGSVFALLGPNGAGKTTTVRILATLSRADAGQARVAGFDVDRDRAPGPPAHQPHRSVRRAGRGADRRGEPADDRPAGLACRGRRPAAAQPNCSSSSTWPRPPGAGWAPTPAACAAWLDLAASLTGRPAVIFLDEPTTGLDPQSRLTTWRAIAGLAADGVTVFLTTQYLDEADRLADQIAVLNGGLLVAAGTAAELKRRVAAQRLDLTCATAEAFEQVRSRLTNRVVHLDPAARTVGVATDGSAAQVRALLDQADPGRDLVASFAVRGATLDDVFFTLTAPAPEVAHV